MIQFHMIAFAAGFVMDLIIGDPHNIPHPIRWIGSLTAKLDRALLGDIPENMKDPLLRDRAGEKRKGILLAVTVILVTAAVSAAVMTAAYRISPIPGAAAEAVLTCYILAQTSLKRESMKVHAKLTSGDLAGARRAVSMIVGRDTEVLDEKGVAKAAVETVAENFSDGVMAPLIYAAIGGPVLGLTYKAINTMDSMVGYKNDRYMWFGWAAARLDDAAGYIPSRISALLLIAASLIAGRNYSAPGAWRIWRRDRRNHKSPNAAQTESAAAGALGIQLAGDAQYFGRVVKKPYIGDDERPVEFDDIRKVNHLMSIASGLGLVLCMGVIMTAAVLIV